MGEKEGLRDTRTQSRPSTRKEESSSPEFEHTGTLIMDF
jgi:hypothetical protein